ncbi:hypothetical protein JCM10213_009090 [Rhodosporidiobolus nylandii]
MPIHSLPLELIDLIFSHLTSPLILERPAFYDDLRSAALVCRYWTFPAQRLLWKQVYLSGCDEQVEKWLAVDFRPGWQVKVLVLTERGEKRTLNANYSMEVLLHLFARCGGITSFRCDLALRVLRDAVPDFNHRFFPDLQSLEVTHPYRDLVQRPALPPNIRILIIHKLPVRAPLVRQDGCFLFSVVSADYAAGRFPSLNRLEVAELNALPRLKALAPSLRTLVLPSEGLGSHLPYWEATPLEDHAAFLAACSNLTRLVIPILVPSSVAHLEIGTSAADAFRTFCVDLDKLSKSWAGVVELRIQDPRNDERFSDMMELWEKVEESCASRGIEVVSGR